MTQEQFRKVFDETCHYAGSGNRTFTEKERDELETKIRKEFGFMDTITLFHALMRTRGYDSMYERAERIIELCQSKGGSNGIP